MKKYFRGLTLLFLCFAFMVATGQVNAQFTDSLGGRWNNPGSALIGTMLNNRMLLEAAKQGQPQMPAANGQPSKQKICVRTTFRPVARRLVVQELAQSMGTDATMRSSLARLFDYYLQTFNGQLLGDSKEARNVASAAAYFVMANYAVATSRQPTVEQVAGARTILCACLSESPDFLRMNDRDRQRLYETLVILGSLSRTCMTDATMKKKTESQERVRDFARQNIQAMLGVPVEKIRLTKDGFAIEE